MYVCVLHVFDPWKNLLEMAQNKAWSFFPANPDLANILGRMDLDLENFHLGDFWDSRFPDSWIFRFPDFQAVSQR